MNLILATDLNLSPLTTGAIAISAISFLIMFAIASAKGGFQDLVDTTLKNDALQREGLKKNSDKFK
tara:strand:- start:612 stop:809 length:198 start_codon:yes stop_codon:yes gene_type:complete